jgi:hypothetical protein
MRNYLVVITLFLIVSLNGCVSGLKDECLKVYTPNIKYGINESVPFTIVNKCKDKLQFYITVEYKDGKSDWAEFIPDIFNSGYSRKALLIGINGDSKNEYKWPKEGNLSEFKPKPSTGNSYRIVLNLFDAEKNRQSKMYSNTFIVDDETK